MHSVHVSENYDYVIIVQNEQQTGKQTKRNWKSWKTTTKAASKNLEKKKKIGAIHISVSLLRARTMSTANREWSQIIQLITFAIFILQVPCYVMQRAALSAHIWKVKMGNFFHSLRSFISLAPFATLYSQGSFSMYNKKSNELNCILLASLWCHKLMAQFNFGRIWLEFFHEIQNSAFLLTVLILICRRPTPYPLSTLHS